MSLDGNLAEIAEEHFETVDYGERDRFSWRGFIETKSKSHKRPDIINALAEYFGKKQEEIKAAYKYWRSEAAYYFYYEEI